MKKDGIAYLLAACAVFGFAGLHRFYLGRPISGVLYLVTWGWLGLGTLHDLIRMRSLISRANAELPGARPQAVHLHIHGAADPQAVRLAALEGMALLGSPATPAPEQAQAQREAPSFVVPKPMGAQSRPRWRPWRPACPWTSRRRSCAACTRRASAPWT